MKKFVAWGALATAIACFTTASAEHHEEVDMAKAMETYMEMAQPSYEHDHFKYYVGNWDYTNTSYWGPEPTVTTGQTHNMLAMEGRYLHSMHKGTMMGRPFEGMSISGYDRVEGEYFNLWFDNWGTGVLSTKGKKQSDTEYEYSGLMSDPLMGKMPVRMITKIINDDKYVFEMYTTPPGQAEMKSMVVEYRRSKGS